LEDFHTEILTDIDWEYPNQNGNTGHDKNNFILLLQTLKQTLGSSYSVSVAIGAGEWRTGLSYNVQQMFAAVDFVNVMTCKVNFHDCLNSFIFTRTFYGNR
jgi:GH18 family chitinase